MKTVISFLFILTMLACASKTKPDVKEVNQQLAVINPEAEIINDMIQLVGHNGNSNEISSSDQIENKAFENGLYKVQKFVDDEIMYQVDIDFTYENDSMAQHAFFNICNHYKNDCENDNTFTSWETNSERGFVVKVLLANKTSFYNMPVIEIKIVEDDNRKYRK